MELKGIIDDIIFRNEDNGYTVAVLSFNEENIEKYVTITGLLPEIHIGEKLKVVGEFKNTKYGEQFAFIELAKDYVWHGVATAELIVNEFKYDTLEILEFSPDKLSKIRGIGKKRAEDIFESYNSSKNMQNAIMFLQKYNISINMAIKIFNLYGNKTIEIVKNNPYILIEDVKGIGQNG